MMRATITALALMSVVFVGCRTEVPVDLMAQNAAHLGENDLAFELLEEMYEKRHAMLVFLRRPEYRRLRSDPRFQDLLRRIGFPES